MMTASDILREVLSSIITMFVRLGEDPRQVLEEVLDAHPLVESARSDIEDAMDAKFGNE